MLSRTQLSLLIVLSLSVTACGLKGPLYRPDEARSESTAPGQPHKKKDTPASPPGEQTEPPIAPPDPDRPVVPPNR
jgi:predicted small lipoprotein YifL